jgi:uncharacterized protein HemY
VRVLCGAIAGLLLGAVLVVGTASYYANSVTSLAAVVAISVTVCALLAWRFGDRVLQSVHKLIQWFW